MVKQSEDKLSKLLKKHKDFTQTQTGKIRCEITNHEMNNIKEFQEYLKGKAYKRAQQSNFDVKDFSQYLDPHFTNPKLLFCRLTGEKVVNKRSVVQKHVKGRRYSRALKKLQDEEQKKLERENEKKQKIKQRKLQKERGEEVLKQMEEEEYDEQAQDDEVQEAEEEEELEPKPVRKVKASMTKHNKIKKSTEKPPTKSKRIPIKA